jgi:hypothetical protein
MNTRSGIFDGLSPALMGRSLMGGWLLAVGSSARWAAFERRRGARSGARGTAGFGLQDGSHDVEEARDVERLLHEHRKLEQELRLEPTPDLAQPFDGLVGASPRMQELVNMIQRIAAVEAGVLITGESGARSSSRARSTREARAGRVRSSP